MQTRPAPRLISIRMNRLTPIFFLLYLSGATSQLSDITSCTGDAITLNCTVESLVHTWDFGSQASILPTTSQDLVIMGFTLRLVESNSNAIVSSVSGIIIPELNNTVISCRDGIQGQGEQQAAVMVFGSPSPPTLAVVTAVDLETFNFAIIPPVYGSQCVLNYTITSTDGDGTTRDITVEVADTEATIALIENGFNLCNNTYSFTIVANTLTGPGERSEVVVPEEVDFLTPQLNVVTSGFSVTITGMVPANSPTIGPNVLVSVQRSSPTSVDCEINVATQPTNGDATVTIMEQLSCRYAGQRVTYCLQFTTDQCDSARVMESTDQLPLLLSSLSEGVSSTAGTVTLMVDVNDQHNCVGQDTFIITATITDGDGTVINTREGADFTDGPITFESVRDGDFTCTVTVVDQMVPIESQQIPCGNSPTSAPIPVHGPIVGGVVGGVAALIVIIVVLVFIILLVLKRKRTSADKVTGSADHADIQMESNPVYGVTTRRH